MSFLSSSRHDGVIVVELTQHQPDLSALIRSMMPGDSCADDVIQRSNLVAWKKRGSFKAGTDFRAWLFAIARLEVMAYRKTAGRKSWLVIDDELTHRLAESMLATTREAPYERFRPALSRCLSRLKPTERSLVERFYFAGRSIKSMAHEDGRGEGALKVSLHRIRATLRGCIEGHLKQNPEAAS